MRRKHIHISILILCAALLISACGSGQGGIKPESSIEGFYGADQRVTGGAEEALPHANVKRVDVEQQNEDTVVTLSFISGSRASDMEESTLNAVPAYETYCLPTPNRFVLSLKQIAFWDFDETEVPTSALLQGVFRCTDSMVSGADGSEADISIYFQFASEVAYQVEEQKDKLVLRFRKATQDTATRFYVTSNLFYDFQEGDISRDLGMLPTLCDDGLRKILISSPFETREQAQAKQTELQAQSAFAVEVLPVVELKPGQLPAYNDELDKEAIYNKNVIIKNGKPTSLPVLMNDGMYLCTTPDGQQMLFARKLVQSADSSEQDDLDIRLDMTELWVVDKEMKKARLTDTDFSTILQAEFSPDGSKLALLDQGREENTLFIIDLNDQNALYNVGEEGFGSTFSFVWDDNSRVIYAVTGFGQQQQLMKYDLGAREGERASSVVDRKMGNGNIAFIGGLLYFCDHDDDSDTGTIYRLNPTDLELEEYATGESFTVSPDKKYMVILEFGALGGTETATPDTTPDADTTPDPDATPVADATPTPDATATPEDTAAADDTAAPDDEATGEDEEGNYSLSLKLKELATGSEKYVIQNEHYSGDAAWTPDSKGIYYMIASRDANEDFPNRLCYYDVAAATNTELVDMVPAAIYATPEDKKLLFMVNEFSEQLSMSFYVTYILDLKI